MPSTISTRLTPRETEILQLIADGEDQFHVAKLLGISRNTVKSHLRNVYRKLDVVGETQAIARAIREQWIK